MKSTVTASERPGAMTALHSKNNAVEERRMEIVEVMGVCFT